MSGPPCYQFFPVTTRRIAVKRIPCGPKSIFPIERHYKRGVCKNVDRTPQTANKVNYESFYSDFCVHRGFMFVELSSSWAKRFKNLSSHCKVFESNRNSWVGPAGETLLRIFSGPHTVELNLEAGKHFFGLCTRRATPLEWICTIFESDIYALL